MFQGDPQPSATDAAPQGTSATGGAGREQVLEAARAMLPADNEPASVEAAAEAIAEATVCAEEQPGECSPHHCIDRGSARLPRLQFLRSPVW